MKITLSEFRDIVAAAVRVVVAEAKKKPKEIAPRSEESVLAQRDRAVRGLHGHSHMNPPGYSHGGDSLDFVKPLGKKNLAKRQGASGMGNWTSEARRVEAIQRLVRMIVREEIKVSRGR